jgi:hypothetical protein
MDEVIALAVALSLAALAAPAPSGPASVTLTVRYSDGSAGDHVAHLRCRRDSGCAIGDWTRAVPLLPRVRAGREP